MKRYTCPCCGYQMFSAPPGSEEICAICGWRDDLMHLRFVLFNGLPNGISLAEAQQNVLQIGAKDTAALASVRFPSSSDERDQDWRPFDPEIDEAEGIPTDFDGLREPEDPATLYYWLPTYYRRIAL